MSPIIRIHADPDPNQAYLEAFSFSNIGKSAALVLVLWAITYALSTLFIKNWLKLRQKARGQG